MVTTTPYEEIENRKYAPLFGYLSSHEDEGNLMGAIHEYARHRGVDDEDFRNAAMTEQGRQVVIGGALKRYHDAVGELTISELYEHFRGNIGLDTETEVKLRTKLPRYTGKIKDIQREIAKLEHDASDKNPDREKAKEAKKKLEEDYKEFRAVYSAINNAQVADLIGPSMKKTSKISLENLVRE